MEQLAPEALARWCQRTLPDDTRAFEQLVTQYKGQVFALAYHLMGNRQEAEDLAQEVFIKVYRGIKSLDEPATLAAWIKRITINACLDAREKQQRRPQSTPLTPNDSDSEERLYADTRTLSPEDAALRHEVRRCLMATLEKMETVPRTALVLRDVDDYSYQEIAQILTISLSAVKMRIQRARMAFRQILETVCPGVAQTALPPEPHIQAQSTQGAI